MTAPATDTTPLVSITFTASALYLTRYSNGKPATSYAVEPEAVSKAFVSAGFKTGVLPSQCLFMTKAGKSTRIGIWVDAGMRKLQFPKGRSLRVPMPGHVFVGEGRQYWIYAAPARPGATDPLLHMPTPNVYGDGRVCTGNVEFPVAGPDTIHAAAALFWESQFSQHLGDHAVRGRGGVEALLKQLQRKRVFPCDRLERARTTVAALAGEGGGR